MSDEKLYRIGAVDGDGPVVRILRAGTWKGFVLCQVVRPGKIRGIEWRAHTLPQAPATELHEVDSQPGLGL